MVLSQGILFVCTGNTCRGLMAEHLARVRLKSILAPTARIASAGIRPQGTADTHNAVQTLKSVFGIDASMHTPQDVHSVDPAGFDLVVSIDDPGNDGIAKAVQALGVPPERHVRWKINDPWGTDPTEYEASALSICKALAQLRKQVEHTAAASA